MKTYLLPGGSAKPVAERYGIDGEDLMLWDITSLNDMTLDAIYKKLDEIIKEDCILVGKSFGGYIALTYSNPYVKQRLLIGPIAHPGERPGNVRVGDVSMDDLCIGVVDDVPTKIIHGTKDEVMPIAEIRHVAKDIGAELIEIDDGHSIKEIPHGH